MTVHLRCPSCGEDTGRPILYGFPTDDAFVRAEAGEFILGGCEADPAVNAGCLACGHRWLHDDDAGGGVTAVDAHVGGFLGPSFRVQSDGRTVTWTGTEDGHVDEAAVIPDPEGWRRFWAVVDQAEAWRWQQRYVDSSMTDGTSWAITLKHDGRAVTATGSNAYPPGWKKVRAALEQLAARPWR